MSLHKFSLRRLLCLLGTCIGCLATSVNAGDLSRDVRQGAQGPDVGDGGYIEVGLGGAAYTSPIYGLPKGNRDGETHYEGFVDVSARYQHRGFFAELFFQGLHEFTLGYNFYNDPVWSLDWVGRSEHFGVIDENENKEFAGLDKRRPDFLTGPRATAYLDNTLVQFHALTDISGTHSGQVYSLNVARYWQYRNWNIHAIVGGTYRSTDVVDYYFSVEPHEASERFPAARVGGGMAYVVELGLTYPVNEKWVWRGFVRRLQIASKAEQSPLIISNHGEVLAASLSYVF